MRRSVTQRNGLFIDLVGKAWSLMLHVMWTSAQKLTSCAAVGIYGGIRSSPKLFPHNPIPPHFIRPPRQSPYFRSRLLHLVVLGNQLGDFLRLVLSWFGSRVRTWWPRAYCSLYFHLGGMIEEIFWRSITCNLEKDAKYSCHACRFVYFLSALCMVLLHV